MRFYVDTCGAARTNCLEAHIRETTRMLCIAEALSHLGHEVAARVSGPFRKSGRDRHFALPLTERDHPQHDDIMVLPAESCLSGTLPCRWRRVGIKVSVGTKNDERISRSFEWVLAHEFDRPRENFIPVPFLVHDRLIADWMVEQFRFRGYLWDDFEWFRNEYVVDDPGLLGFCGCGWPIRKAFTKEAPEWADILYYDSHLMDALEHARWLMGFRGGLLLPGDTPKCNLFPELVLLGRVVVAPKQERQCIPPIDETNSIVFESWEQVRRELEDEEHCAQLVAQATSDYVSGWGPLGQAKLLLERLL